MRRYLINEDGRPSRVTSDYVRISGGCLEFMRVEDGEHVVLRSVKITDDLYFDDIFAYVPSGVYEHEKPTTPLSERNQPFV